MTLFYSRRAQVTLVSAANPASSPVSIFAGGDAGFGNVGASSLPATQPFQMFNPAYRFDGLHLRFKSEKTLLGTPNTLELVIYNLASTTRKRMQEQGSYVQLNAGYQSDFPNLPLVFKGNARTIDHVRRGPDWETRIQCGDGETAYRFGVASKSWGPGTTAAFIATYLAQQITQGDIDPFSNNSRIDISYFLTRVNSLAYPQTAFAYGFAIQGNAFEELQRLLGPKYTLSIQDGELRALQAADGVNSVYVLSAKTGLIGSPEHSTPNLAGQPPLLKLNTLLNPRIKPGDIVNVDSMRFQGNFRVQAVSHLGDLGANDWSSEIHGTPTASGNLPAN